MRYLVILAAFIASPAYAQSFGMDSVRAVEARSPQAGYMGLIPPSPIQQPIVPTSGGNYYGPNGPIVQSGGAIWMPAPPQAAIVPAPVPLLPYQPNR